VSSDFHVGIRSFFHIFRHIGQILVRIDVVEVRTFSVLRYVCCFFVGELHPPQPCS
jgi:hypothetical protein